MPTQGTGSNTSMWKPMDLLDDATTMRAAGGSAWTPGDRPEEHPLWETEVELERGMLKAGADAFRDRVIEARERGQLTRLAPVRGLLQDWLPEVASGIRNWVRAVKDRKGGPTPIALPYVDALDPYAAAAVALREVLDGMALKRPHVVTLAERVGRLLEYEQRVRLWEEKEPELFYHYKQDMDKGRATSTHRRRVNINRFNHLSGKAEEEGLDLHWDAWSQEIQFRVGIAVLDCVVRHTGWFEVQPDPDHIWRKGRANRPKLILAPKEGMSDWLARTLDDAEVASAVFRPTVMPPKRWKGTRRGGYWTPYVNPPRLVRFKASQETQKEFAADEYDAFDMPKVYDAIHMLQETPYRVNGRVLDVAKMAWALDREIAKLPKVGEVPLPARTPRMVEHDAARRDAKADGLTDPVVADAKTQEEIIAWKKKASRVHKFNAKRLSRKLSTSMTVLIADQFRDYEAIYFPHMLDFRSRMYPICDYLQPQGNDLARGLLTFAEGVPITEESGGAGWLAIQLANVWGNDKVDFDERIAWVEEREDLWRRIAEEPMQNLEWATADKPFQSLAAVFEWVAFLDHGFGYVSHLPIMVDGTCNGIQHLSAIIRDEVSGFHVNLVPSKEPQDIYRFVASRLQPTIERIEKAGGAEGEKASYWLDLTVRNIPRTLTKRPVMVVPYGGTKDAFFKYIREWLDENDPVADDATEEDNDIRNGRITFMVLHMWDAVGSVVKGGLSVMKWLQDCAKVAAVEDQPIYWVTPAGFVVRHFYGLSRDIRVEVMLDGERYTVTRGEKTAKLSTKEQLQGIAPNFIHSLDASCLQECLSRCRKAGIKHVMTVHDAYGTHAANMWTMARLIREAFVATHEVDVLGEFRAACQRVVVSKLVTVDGMDPLEASEKADEMLPAPLPKGLLDLNAVLQSDYFFA